MTKKMGKISVAAVALLAAAFMCSDASAWWGGCCGWSPAPFFGGGCCAPCMPVYDSCCSPCVSTCSPCVSSCSPCGGTYVLGCRPGPIRRLLFGSTRWYNVGYGGYGCGGCGWDCCTTTVDSCCGGGVSDDTIYNSTPYNTTPSVTPATPQKRSAIEPSPVSVRGQNPGVYQTSYQKFQNSQNRNNSGLLTIYVPLDAKVYVNEKLTSTEGSKRAFVSFGLDAGYEYEYHVRAEVVRDGKLYPETQTIILRAGENRTVSFPFRSLNKSPMDEEYGMN